MALIPMKVCNQTISTAAIWERMIRVFYLILISEIKSRMLCPSLRANNLKINKTNILLKIRNHNSKVVLNRN